VKKQHIADSMLNRVLNFLDDLAEPTLPSTGAQLDAALAAPVAPISPEAAPQLADALVTQGLGLKDAP